ncbi:hypothetical protein BT93_H3041 [Corymbia citriodora subsp. variegata]|nr:hypothetical protein BT93_H3041 [Corymbia citriodora subsp. variegata]
MADAWGGGSGPASASRSRGALKRKRGNSSSSRSLFKSLGADEWRDRIASLEAEIQGVLAYCREMMERRELALDPSLAECGSANGAIACCLEESASIPRFHLFWRRRCWISASERSRV